MQLSEFLNLPKNSRDYKSRIAEELKNLKQSISLTPKDDVVNAIDCHCCGKKTFATRKEAIESISNTAKNSKYRPVRAYMCENGNWHLTSMPLRNYEKRKNN